MEYLTIQALGRRVREHRTAAGLTQLQLSEETGVAQSNISVIENRPRRKHLKLIIRLLEHFGDEVDGPFYSVSSG